MIVKLVIFSLSIQAAAGAMVFAMIANKISKKNHFKTTHIIAAVLGVVGFSAFLLYLGNPNFIFNTLSQISHSWLSREILFIGLFIGFALFNILVLLEEPKVKRFAWIAGVLGLIAVFTMVNAYRATSIVAWKSMNTYVDFFAATIILGIVFIFVADYKEMGLEIEKSYSYIGLAVVVVQAVATVFYYFRYDSFESFWMLLPQSLLLLIGAAILFVPSIRKKEEKLLSKSLIKNGLGAFALISGLIINRYFFYAVFLATKGL